MSLPSRVAKLSLFVLFLMASAGVHAAEFSYSYVDVSYLRVDSANGGNLNGSYEVARNVRLFGGVGFASNSGVDVTTYGAGLGYIARFNDAVNLALDVGYAGAKADVGSFDFRTNDVAVGASLRLRAAPNFEFEPSLSYLLGDTDELGYNLDARYWVNSQLAIQAGVGGVTGGGDAAFTIGLRFGPSQR